MRIILLIISLLSSVTFARTANQVMRMPSSGNVPSYGAVNLASSAAVTGVLPAANLPAINLASGSAVTGILPRANLPSVGQQISAGISNFNSSSSSYTSVTGLSVTITTTGRPVVIFTQGDATDTASIQISSSSGALCLYRINRGATVVSSGNFGNFSSGAWNYPMNSFYAIDAVAAGTYTYSVSVKYTGSGGTIQLVALQLVAYEL